MSSPRRRLPGDKTRSSLTGTTLFPGGPPFGAIRPRAFRPPAFGTAARPPIGPRSRRSPPRRPRRLFANTNRGRSKRSGRGNCPGCRRHSFRASSARPIANERPCSGDRGANIVPRLAPALGRLSTWNQALFRRIEGASRRDQRAASTPRGGAGCWEPLLRDVSGRAGAGAPTGRGPRGAARRDRAKRPGRPRHPIQPARAGRRAGLRAAAAQPPGDELAGLPAPTLVGGGPRSAAQETAALPRPGCRHPGTPSSVRAVPAISRSGGAICGRKAFPGLDRARRRAARADNRPVIRRDGAAAAAARKARLPRLSDLGALTGSTMPWPRPRRPRRGLLSKVWGAGRAGAPPRPTATPCRR